MTNTKKRSIIFNVGTGLLLAFAKAKTKLKDPFKSTAIRPKGHYTRSFSMKQFMNTRLMIVLVMAIVSVGLAACGGGGNDAATPVSTISAAFAEPAAQVATPAAREVLPQRFAAATSSPFGDAAPLDAANQLMDFVQVNFPQFFPSHQPTLGGSGGFVFRYYPELGTFVAVIIDLPGATPGDVYVLGGPFGNSVRRVAPLTAFTVPVAVPAWWKGVSIAPMGTKVMGFHELSGFSTTIGDAAWQRAVQDGTIKVVDTGALMAGFSNLPIAWTVFTRGTSFCTTPVYKSNSGIIGNLARPGSMCNSEAFDWVMGTKDGIIRHFVNRNECFEIRWDMSLATFNDFRVQCP